LGRRLAGAGQHGRLQRKHGRQVKRTMGKAGEERGETTEEAGQYDFQ
jgi:hypothetical protein